MDLVIRGGYVVDPSQSLEGTMDVEIARGRVRRVAPHIEPGGRRTLNAKGKNRHPRSGRPPLPFL